jgi:tetratricopeptide (TPR) repeat protein
MAVDVAEDPDLFEQRVALAERMYAEADEGWSRIDSPETGRRRAVLLSKMAQSVLLRGKVAERQRADSEAAEVLLRRGNEMIQRAITRFEQLRRDTPADYQLARDLWVVMHYLGQSRFDAANTALAMGKDDLAGVMRQEALAIFLDLKDLAESLAMDQSNLEAQRDLATTLNKLGNTLRVLDRHGEARQVFSENAQRWQAIYRTDPVERHLRDLAVGLYKVAEVDELLANGAKTQAERQAILRLTRSGYMSALETFRQYAQRGGPAEAVIATVQESIDRVDQKIAAD